MVRGQHEGLQQSVLGHQSLRQHLLTSELQNGMFW